MIQICVLINYNRDIGDRDVINYKPENSTLHVRSLRVLFTVVDIVAYL